MSFLYITGFLLCRKKILCHFVLKLSLSVNILWFWHLDGYLMTLKSHLKTKRSTMSFNSEFEKYAVKHRGLSSNTLHSYASHLVTGLTPNIIEERPMNVAVMDVYSRLMMDRIIFLGYPINDEVANIVTAQLLFLDSTDRTRDINMYINSPGGSVYSGSGCI